MKSFIVEKRKVVIGQKKENTDVRCERKSEMKHKGRVLAEYGLKHRE